MKKVTLSKDHVHAAFREYLRKYYSELWNKEFDIEILVPGEYYNKDFEIYIKDHRNEKTSTQLNFRLNDDCTRSR